MHSQGTEKTAPAQGLQQAHEPDTARQGRISRHCPIGVSIHAGQQASPCSDIFLDGYVLRAGQGEMAVLPR